MLLLKKNLYHNNHILSISLEDSNTFKMDLNLLQSPDRPPFSSPISILNAIVI